jgi:hypothetical protein
MTLKEATKAAFTILKQVFLVGSSIIVEKDDLFLLHFITHGFDKLLSNVESSSCDISFQRINPGDTKRCRLSLLTNSALVIRVQLRGGGEVTGSQPMSTAVHIT